MQKELITIWSYNKSLNQVRATRAHVSSTVMFLKKFMKVFLVLLMLIPLHACAAGEYYVFSDNDKYASHSKIHEADMLSISIFHFDGKSSAILLATKSEVEITITKLATSISANGINILPKQSVMQSESISLKADESHTINFVYENESRPETITENITFAAIINGNKINIEKKYLLTTKAYGWFDALQGI